MTFNQSVYTMQPALFHYRFHPFLLQVKLFFPQMRLVRTILQKCFVLHLLSSDNLMAQGCISSFPLKKAQFSIYLLAQINNKENGIWLEGSIFLIPERPHLPDGNVDA